MLHSTLLQELHARQERLTKGGVVQAVRCALHSPTTATAEVVAAAAAAEAAAAAADEAGADSSLSTWEQLHERDWPEAADAADGGGAVSLGGVEVAAARGTMLARSLWRFHEPVSFGHFRAWFGRTLGAAAAHPLLAAFLEHEAELPLVKHIADMLPWLRIVQHAYGDGAGTARLKRASCRVEGGALAAKEGEELVTMAHAVEAYTAGPNGNHGSGKAAGSDNEGEAGERRREAEAALAAFCRAFNAVLPKIDTIHECDANPFIAGSHPDAVDVARGRLKEGAATHVDLRSYLSAAERVEDRANAVGLSRAAPIAFALPNPSKYDGDVYDAEMCCVDQVRSVDF